jgi:hypothetical protein
VGLEPAPKTNVGLQPASETNVDLGPAPETNVGLEPASETNVGLGPAPETNVGLGPINIFIVSLSGHSLTGGDKEIFPYRDALLTPVHVRTADSRSVFADDFPVLPCTLMLRRDV